MQGPVLLIKWRKAHELTQSQAAERFGVKQPSLSGYESGKMVPKVDAAVRIDRETDGEVPVESWMDEADRAPADGNAA